MKEFINFFKNNISIIISCLAFLISLFQIIREAWKKREKYSVDINNIQFFEQEKENEIILNLTIINNSTAPLNVTKIRYFNNGVSYLCYLSKKWGGEHYYPKFPETDIPRTERVFSSDFPLFVPPQGAINSIIVFDVDKLICKAPKSFELQIFTNNRIKKKIYKCLDNKQDLTYL